VAGWTIGANVGEVEIESDEYPGLAKAGAQHVGVRLSAEAFPDHRLDVVAGILQQRLGVARNIFIQLEAEAHPLRLVRRESEGSAPVQGRQRKRWLPECARA